MQIVFTPKQKCPSECAENLICKASKEEIDWRKVREEKKNQHVDIKINGEGEVKDKKKIVLPNYLQRHVFQPNTDAISVPIRSVIQIA